MVMQWRPLPWLGDCSEEKGSRRFSDRLATNNTNSYVKRTLTQLTKHGRASHGRRISTLLLGRHRVGSSWNNQTKLSGIHHWTHMR